MKFTPKYDVKVNSQLQSVLAGPTHGKKRQHLRFWISLEPISSDNANVTVDTLSE